MDTEEKTATANPATTALSPPDDEAIQQAEVDDNKGAPPVDAAVADSPAQAQAQPSAPLDAASHEAGATIDDTATAATAAVDSEMIPPDEGPRDVDEHEALAANGGGAGGDEDTLVTRPSSGSKETTYMKLKNRIKDLEVNLNLSST